MPGAVDIPKRLSNILIEGGRFMFPPNFTGREGEYNREGDRNFTVALDEELAANLLRDGWNVKRAKPRDGEEQGNPYLSVTVGFKGNRPPRLVLITSKGRTEIPEEMAHMLDWVDVASIDIAIRPYHWTVRENSGIKAYLKSIFITVDEDYFDRKYADVPEVTLAGETLELNRGSDERDRSEDIVDAEIVSDEEISNRAIGSGDSEPEF